MTFIDAPDLEKARSESARLFAEAYGYEPELTVACPGRANLLGEHTDYSGGTCLPFALPQVTVISAGRPDERPASPKPGPGGVLRATTVAEDGTRLSAEIPVAEIAAGHPALSGDQSWFGYVAGVWAGLENAGLEKAGLEQRGHGGSGHEGGGQGPLALPGDLSADLMITSSVPTGAGLSSSAALEGAAGLALLALAGHPELDDELRGVLATACMYAENEIVGAKTGGLDQTAALRSEAGQLTVLDCRDFSVRTAPFDVAASGLALLIIDTRAPHMLADGQYAARRAQTEAAARALGVDLLRNALGEHPTPTEAEEVLARWDALSPQQLADAGVEDPGVVRKRLRHTLTESARVQRIIELMEGETETDWAEVGEIISATHASLRDDFTVTIPQLDLAAETAEKAGALGARMVGGGFGGSVLALVRESDTDAVSTAVLKAFAEKGYTEPAFLLAVPSEKGRRLD